MPTFITELTNVQGDYAHRFGGDRWTIECPSESSPEPWLFVTLDTRDPRIGIGRGATELPLCSRGDYETPERQSYRFYPSTRTVVFDEPGWNVEQHPDDLLLRPLDERKLHLRTADASEEPRTADKYAVQDTFLGGTRFIRVGGEPLWLDRPVDVRCPAGHDALFIAAMGYEPYTRPSGIVSPTRPFFIGELALYFFICYPCQRIIVISQPA